MSTSTPPRDRRTERPHLTKDEGSSADIRALTEQVVRLVRAVKAWRGIASDPHRHPHTAAHLLLWPLHTVGPLRSTVLAEAVHADPSTVSRHVSLLLAEGLVERQADPTDGRASLLAITDQGRARVAEMRRERDAAFAAALDAWDPKQVGQLACLLTRFNDDFERAFLRAQPTQEAS